MQTPEITPLELVTAVERGDELQIVDVRPPASRSAGRIDLLPPDRLHNIAASLLLGRTDLSGTSLSPGLRTVVACGHGNDSLVVAAHLRSLGLEAWSLRGGLAAWMDALVERAVSPPAALDGLVQFDRIGKGSLAYLLVSEGQALLVDPPRDASVMLAAAQVAGARIVGVADTHVHADYISGAPAISRALGVPYYLHPADNAYPCDGTPGRLAIAPLSDSSEIRVGRATLEARHNPGHTEGSVSFAIGDDAVLSGDFIFVDSVGRPDLAGRADEWAALLWESLEHARRAWRADTVLLPGHYSGPGERRADRVVAGRFGDLLRSNAALGITDRAAFHAWVTAKASVPEAYLTIKAVNAGLRRVSDDEATELDAGRNECAVARPVA